MAWYLILGLERMNKSQAIDQHSNNFTQLNYGLLVYMKTAYLMRYMADFLGRASLTVSWESISKNGITNTPAGRYQACI